MVPQSQYTSYFTKYLDSDGAAVHLAGHTRIALATNQEVHGRVKMSLMYSRLTRSDDDHRDFWGTSPTEREIHAVQYEIDPMIANEIRSHQPLPPPFSAAYDICKDNSLSMKQYLNSVCMGQSDLATQVSSNGLTMPAVLIGDAAHAIPAVMSASDINVAIWDALMLCSMIIDRYDNDVLFSQINKDFYNVRYQRWQSLQTTWQKQWLPAHGLPWDVREARKLWVRFPKLFQGLEQQYVTETQWQSLPKNMRQGLLYYKENERARMAVIEQRIRDRSRRDTRLNVPPGTDPTKLVLRYLESSPRPDKIK